MSYNNAGNPPHSQSLENADFYEDNPFNFELRFSQEFNEKNCINQRFCENFSVEIPEFFFVKKKAFYRIRSKKNAKIMEIDKNYADFKELHAVLKAYAKNIGENIEELPSKGNLSIFANAQQVAEFRKFALQVFLKYLLNHEKFKDNKDLLRFIGFL